VVYSTDESGSALQKLGSLQFLFEPQEDVPEGRKATPPLDTSDLDVNSLLLDAFSWELCDPDALCELPCGRGPPDSPDASAGGLANESSSVISDGESGAKSCDTAAFGGIGHRQLEIECLSPSPCSKRPRLGRLQYADSPISYYSNASGLSGSCSATSFSQRCLESPASDVSASTLGQTGFSLLSSGNLAASFASPFGMAFEVESASLPAAPEKLPGNLTPSGPVPPPTAPESPHPASGRDLAPEAMFFEEAPTPLRQGIDVRVQPCWGMNNQTFKKLLTALAQSDCFAEGSTRNDKADSRAERCCFIEERLLPAVQLAGPQGCNLPAVLSDMLLNARSRGDMREAEICAKLSSEVSAHETHKRGRAATASQEASASSAEYRLHAKGPGVICLRPGGIPAGTFVGFFSGEVYTPWRWFEKQDSIRRISGWRSADALLSSAILERPKHADCLGYDVVFVDSTHGDSLGSKVAHGCNPNCRAVAVGAAGELSLGVFTTRHVPVGQELCWDHALVTELEQEHRNATCLCSSSCCRGSSLYYVNSKPFHEVLAKKHSFLDRTAMILAACSDELTPEDEQRLLRHGVSSSVLTDPSLNNGKPLVWCKKWASLLIQYIEQEAAILPNALTQTHGYSEAQAQVEVDAIRSNRIQNLACTLDKAKYFLSKQSKECRSPPVRMLTELEVVKHLWTGPTSIGRRFASLCVESLQHNPTTGNVEKQVAELAKRTPKSKAECQQLLRELATTMKSVGPSHYAAHDCILLYASTECFFEPAKYVAVSTNPKVESVDDAAAPQTGKATKAGRSGKKKSDTTASKKYRPGFLWGQLSAWFKQTVRDPSASLSADRRGTVSLPDPECCFGKEIAAGKYSAKDRVALVHHIESTPSIMWPLQTIWSFKNPSKVYGSPMLDVAIRRARGDPNSRSTFDFLLAEFRSTL